MINLKSLIDFLPPIFKNTDTYKVEGKGILERFLEVCGEYLEDDITPDIENTLDLIDIKNIDPIYLNYLWELLGEIPFGSNIAIDKEQWDRYYEGTLSKEELTKLSKNWIIPKDGIISLDETRIKTLLKYSLTLLKVRGTKKFFETLFEIYGISCTISDIYGNDEGLYAKLSKLDTDSAILDNTTTDYVGHCNDCLSIKINISTHYMYSDISGILIVGKDDTYFATGGKQTKVKTYEGVNLYNSYYSNHSELSAEDLTTLNGFVLFRRTMEQLFDKYLPCNVKPIITYDGVTPDDKLSLSISYETTNTTLTDEADHVDVKINITSLWPNTDTRYQVSSDGINWSDKLYKAGEVFSMKVIGDYYFRSIADPSKNDALSVSDQRTNTQKVYSLNLIDTSLMVPNVSLGAVSDYRKPIVKTFLSDSVPTKEILIQVLINGKETQESLELEVVDNKGKFYRSGSKFIASEVGEYTFTLTNIPTTFAKLEVLYYNQTDLKSSYLMGLNYGVSAEVLCSESYYDNDEHVTKQDSYSSGEPFGIYGLLDGADMPVPFGYNSFGNVVNLVYKHEDTSSGFSELKLRHVTPWAYKYDKYGGIIKEPIKLSLVDIWYSDQPSQPITIHHSDAQYTVSDIDMLKTKLSFQRLTTVSVDYLEEGTIDLLEIASYSRLRGGVFLLHPNTQELVDNGIQPNFNDRDFYSNFLVVVIPGLTRDGTPLRGFQNSVLTETLQINKYKYSTYGRRGNYGLMYDHIVVDSIYEGNNLNHLTYYFSNIDSGSMDDDGRVTLFDHTRIVAFNVTPYNSNFKIYYPWESEEGDFDNPFTPSGAPENKLVTNYVHKTEQVNPIIIFMDRLAPFVNTQYMVYRSPLKLDPNTVSGLADGFYIEPVYDGNPEFETIWENIPESGLLSSDIPMIPIYPSPLTSPQVDPAKFKFIAYTGGIELPIPYYICDMIGNEYLPGVNYSIKDMGQFEFILLPHSMTNQQYGLHTPIIRIWSEPSYQYFSNIHIDKSTHIIPKSIDKITVAAHIYSIHPQLGNGQYIVRTNSEGTEIIEKLTGDLFVKEEVREDTTFYFAIYSSIDDEFWDKEPVTIKVIKNI